MHKACLSGSSNSDISSQETIIHQIFGSFLRSRVTCQSCNTVFDFFKVFQDILLKIKVVEYPEYLDLRPYMSDLVEEPVLYSLYAVVVHTGHTCLGGHFFCYTKASNGQWYKMNDTSVDSCSIHTVLGQQAYLLFYVR
ncbi:Ubiquitin carboxyl-terminal hydrolase 42 [Lonchura striata]|uniref:Ubiquitin carboxyl-terminal hydrolase 36 n=1 Tax=Lonchura striata TaxID=40157 RepID=A0A218UU51_9PASE|nr:Ubiquitin carboxyl-terminal hydrolase 42 [Lonchura striata domestica]